RRSCSTAWAGRGTSSAIGRGPLTCCAARSRSSPPSPRSGVCSPRSRARRWRARVSRRRKRPAPPSTPGTPPPTGARGGYVRWAMAGAALVALAAGALLFVHRSPPRARPDVLLVTIDTLRADHVGCYGDGQARTPVLDALAARGVRFATAVAHAPLT